MLFILFIHSSPILSFKHVLRIEELFGRKAHILGAVKVDVAILQRKYRESGKIVSRRLRPAPSFTNNGLQQQRVEVTHSNVASLETSSVLCTDQVWSIS